MGDGIKAFWLGVFIIITVGVAAWLLLFLRPTVGDGGTLLRVRFSNIQNVAIGTRVTFAGKAVGEVVKIDELFDARSEPPDASGNLYFYQLDLRVDSSVKIYNYDEIIFSTSGLLGEKSIAIVPRAAPAGAPPPHDVTSDILYARSTDTLEETLSQFSDVAGVFETTMTHINEFLDANMEEFHETLTSVNAAADSITIFADQMTESELACKASDAAEAVTKAMNSASSVFNEVTRTNLVGKVSRTVDQITSSEGTLGRLLNSDSFYLQMTAVMCKLETVLGDIGNYGLLFQYDKSWKRKRIAKENCMRQLCTPQQAACFFNQEMCEVVQTLDRVERLLCRLDCCPSQQDPCFSNSFRELMGRVENLLSSLKSYNEMLFQQYCQGCY